MLSRYILPHWRLKLLLTFLLNAIFWTGYQILARNAFFPVNAVPLTWLDTAVPFKPEPWAWIYLTHFTFSGVVPWLIIKRDEIWRYAVGVAVMMAISFTIFLFLPTQGPRPLEVGQHAAMRFIATFDGSLNAFPSLHAAFIVYMAALAYRLFGRVAPLWTIVVAVVWGFAILYGTLATKQHYVLDLIAGGLLGFLADQFAWRRSGPAGTPD